MVRVKWLKQMNSFLDRHKDEYTFLIAQKLGKNRPSTIKREKNFTG